MTGEYRARPLRRLGPGDYRTHDGRFGIVLRDDADDAWHVLAEHEDDEGLAPPERFPRLRDAVEELEARIDGDVAAVDMPGAVLADPAGQVADVQTQPPGYHLPDEPDVDRWDVKVGGPVNLRLPDVPGPSWFAVTGRPVALDGGVVLVQPGDSVFPPMGSAGVS